MINATNFNMIPPFFAKEDIVVNSDTIFTDSEGNVVSADRIVLVKQEVKNSVEQIVNKVNEITKDAKEKVVFYYDIKYVLHFSC